MVWGSSEKAGSRTADSEIQLNDQDIEAFFVRNGFDVKTRDVCDEYACVQFPGSEATPTPTQGYCSYTLNLSEDYLLQFRPEAFMLDIDTCSEVKAIYGKFAPTTTYVGKVQGIAIQSSDINDGSPAMHAYLHKRIQGIPLSEFWRRRREMNGRDADDKIFKKRLMRGLAKVFALGFRGRQSLEDVAMLAGSISKGKIGESMRWRLGLLNGLLGEDLLRHVSEAQARLDSIEASDWCLTHGDVLPGNMMVDAKSGRLTGLIDWAEAEWLPFGMALYGVEEVLGEHVPSEGFRYYNDHEELRQLFWSKFLSLTKREAIQPTRVEASRRLGILLWRGIAFDDGRMDRVVEAGRDDSEIQKLRLFLEAPSVLEISDKARLQSVFWDFGYLSCWEGIGWRRKKGLSASTSGDEGRDLESIVQNVKGTK